MARDPLRRPASPTGPAAPAPRRSWTTREPSRGRRSKTRLSGHISTADGTEPVSSLSIQRVPEVSKRAGGCGPPRSFDAPAVHRRATFLRPAGARCRRPDAQHLARARALEHVLWTSPLGGHHEQRAAVRAAERAGEAPAVELDRLEHLAALANAHTALVGDVSVPDRVLRVEADAVGETVSEVGPHPP